MACDIFSTWALKVASCMVGIQVASDYVLGSKLASCMVRPKPWSTHGDHIHTASPYVAFI